MTVTRHLVTGATGFVGGALVLELLAADPDAEVICLVRESSREAAAIRLRRHLHRAAKLYGCGRSTLDAIDERTRAAEGDILADRCGLNLLGLGDVDEVWHSAATLDFREEFHAEIAKQNVSGTRNVLATAQELGARVLNHVSTAYVAGARMEVISEAAPLDVTDSNNAYERSKIEAENVVAASGFPARILRPGIVIGHGRTYAATGTTGVYSFIRDLQTLTVQVERSLGKLLRHRALRVRAVGNAALNLIPVDVVAATAVALSLRTAPAMAYHLTNSTPPTVSTVTAVVCEELGIRPMALMNSADGFSGIDERFDTDPRTRFFHPYVMQRREFQTQNVEAILGSEALRYPMPEECWRMFVRWYLSELAAERSTNRSRRNTFLRAG